MRPSDWLVTALVGACWLTLIGWALVEQRWGFAAYIVGIPGIAVSIALLFDWADRRFG